MQKASILAKLFSAIGSNDLPAAHSIALEMARAEANNGHHAVAKLLQGSLQPNGNGGRIWHTQSGETMQVGGIINALIAVTNLEPIERVVLTTHARRELDDVVREWKARKALERKGIRRRNKLLFYGPPGCGKSLTARALGRELALPVYTLRFDAIVGAFLGQTAQRLRQLFEFASFTACVLLIDEIDALGKRRGNPMDVGELDRIVISLMQELEHSEPKGLLVAASNLAGSLDEALWRRFDLVVEFPKPGRTQLTSFALSHARDRGVAPSPTLRRAIAASSTFADAVRAIENEQRTVVISAS
ncbi:AAA family ATPase [Candidatus Binatus soli]|jgi:SpoVK/Ycf46/Vps4 family AAA+-type ATPase|uniref:AAA family ATPase n=1 Tax=Candidatus Binatus soli TaxID=1953413 RepID=UPI003D141B27